MFWYMESNIGSIGNGLAVVQAHSAGCGSWQSALPPLPGGHWAHTASYYTVQVFQQIAPIAQQVNMLMADWAKRI